MTPDDFDPFNREMIELPDGFEHPTEPVSNADFVTLSLKLIYAETACTWGHWCEVKVDGDEAGEGDQERLYQILKHLESIKEGLGMIAERMLGFASHEVRGQLVQERLEEVHGIAFKRRAVFGEDGKQVGWGFEPEDATKEVEGIEQWLSDQGG